MSQESVEVVQSLYEAFNRRDYARAVEYLDPEVRGYFEDDGETCQAWTVKSKEVTVARIDGYLEKAEALEAVGLRE